MGINKTIHPLPFFIVHVIKRHAIANV